MTPVGKSRLIGLLAGATLMCAIIGGSALGAPGVQRHGSARLASGCSVPYPAQRDPSNPLALDKAPGANPLTGANFFVDGPRHGLAAGAIAQLLGLDPTSFADDISWSRFEVNVNDKLAQEPAGVANNVRLLEKIADEPEQQRFSSFSAGGGPGKVLGQVQKILCGNLTADPGSIPIITTYFLHASLKGCPSTGQIHAYMPTFKRRVNEVITGIGRQPVAMFLEIDALGSSACIAKHGALPAWEAALRYEVDRAATLPHAVVYVEAGYSDAQGPGYTARALNHVDIRKIRGFFTNDTHENWTINEIKWGEKVSKMTHGADFVVNTAQNGDGPKLNPHPHTQGVEDLCNPPGRALGPKPTTATGFPHVDGFLWITVPGVSGGNCGGGPPSGTFWPARAEGLAARADGKLGPGYPSRHY
jgi:endoglucanase